MSEFEEYERKKKEAYESWKRSYDMFYLMTGIPKPEVSGWKLPKSKGELIDG